MAPIAPRDDEFLLVVVPSKNRHHTSPDTKSVKHHPQSLNDDASAARSNVRRCYHVLANLVVDTWGMAA